MVHLGHSACPRPVALEQLIPLAVIQAPGGAYGEGTIGVGPDIETELLDRHDDVASFYGHELTTKAVSDQNSGLMDPENVCARAFHIRLFQRP